MKLYEYLNFLQKEIEKNPEILNYRVVIHYENCELAALPDFGVVDLKKGIFIHESDDDYDDTLPKCITLN